MGTPTDQVIEFLGRCGTHPAKLGKFVQSELGGRNVAPGQVDEGFCNGVCIDWARRVLLGGKPIFTTNVMKDGPQTLRQATIQLTVEGKNSAFNEVTETRNKLVDTYNPQRNQAEVAISPQLETELQKYLDFNPVPTRKYRTERVERWLDLLNEEAARANYRTEVGWSALVHNLDDYHSRKRREEDRNPSSRPFSHIKPLKTQNRTQYDSIRAAANTLLQLNEFVANTVLILGFGLVSDNSSTGHAVAVHKLGTGRYRFLDPNYGVFDYDISGVFTALLYLFGSDYKTNGGQIYGEDGYTVTGAVSYVLLGRA